MLQNVLKKRNNKFLRLHVITKIKQTADLLTQHFEHLCFCVVIPSCGILLACLYWQCTIVSVEYCYHVRIDSVPLCLCVEIHGLENPKAVEALQSQISLSLQYYEEGTRPIIAHNHSPYTGTESLGLGFKL